MARGQRCREARGVRLGGECDGVVQECVRCACTPLPKRWTEDGSTSVLPANHVRPHNVKEEAAVAAVEDVVASHVSTWASETVSLLVLWTGNMVQGVR